MSDRYHSLHVAPPQAGYESVAWWPAAPRADRIRIREHTCDCRTLSYELCQGGGLMFIRRTYRSGGVLIEESDWMPTAQAEQLWKRLLLGEVR
ncbi:hypothetical protein HS048_02335 [Planomonospora sp. ID91781]|uniref:hypothetical protein n=1 Tax=Planomonospora sp. ID91781 TaxID=2738135 RepID=UPI0018C3BB8E|nr:hypothetical protein [Planomonospora sp. ID91781]MBG0819597.1 hypothetical protein [Planomonospora sp. ID91781]